MTDTNAREVLVFDTGPLSHFAEAGWLGILRFIVGDRIAVIPDAVAEELHRGSSRAHVQTVLAASWIERRELRSDEEIHEFVAFSARLVVDDRNLGEAAVLAYAKANGATAIIDDGAARSAAKAHDVRCRGTLGLLCDAIRDGHATVGMVSALADHLIESEYRLPFSPGGFAKWAVDNGLG